MATNMPHVCVVCVCVWVCDVIRYNGYCKVSSCRLQLILLNICARMTPSLRLQGRINVYEAWDLNLGAFTRDEENGNLVGGANFGHRQRTEREMHPGRPLEGATTTTHWSVR